MNDRYIVVAKFNPAAFDKLRTIFEDRLKLIDTDGHYIEEIEYVPETNRGILRGDLTTIISATYKYPYAVKFKNGIIKIVDREDIMFVLPPWVLDLFIDLEVLYVRSDVWFTEFDRGI